MRISQLPCLLMALVMVGCLPAPGGVTPPKGTVRPAGASPKPSGSPSPSTSPTGPVVSASPSAPVPVAQRSLEGTVRLPALLASRVPILSDNGASVVGNNGGSLIGNNGSSLIGKTKFRTLANEPVALSGVAVRLVDAAGQAVMVDGKPLTTVTDAQGRYGFEAALPTRNLLVEVLLEDGAGAARAIAPPAAQRTVDVDLASTLSTNYILARYVKTQTDPLATLEKLPAAVEAETRTKTAAAFAGGQTAVPESLTDEQVVAAVEQLRAGDKTLDAQLETVKQLLIAAGQSDLGNGQLATDVLLGKIRQLLPAPDGSLYLNDGVAWRVTPEGRLVRLTSPGDTGPGLAGKKAVDAKLGAIEHMALDPEGRLWLLQGPSPGHAVEKLFRIEADGTLKDMSPGLTHVDAFVPTGGDGYLAFGFEKWGEPVDMWEVNGASPKKLKTFTGNDGLTLASASTMARDAQGRVLLCGLISLSVIPKAYKLDPATGALSLVRAAGTDGVGTVGLDALANVYSVKDKVVRRLAPDGTETVVAGIEHFPMIQGLAAGPNGSHYMLGGADNTSVYRLKDGVKTLYAGKEGQATQGSPGSVTGLKDPRALAVAPDGTLYVVDDGMLLRFKGDAPAETLLAKGALKDGDTVLTPGLARCDANGVLHFIGMGAGTFGLSAGVALYRLKADGTPEQVYKATHELQAFLFGPGGEIYLSEMRNMGLGGHPVRVLRRKADGQVETLLDEDQQFLNQQRLAFDAQGNLLLEGGRREGTEPIFYRIWRFKPGQAPELLPETAFFPEAWDARGRAYDGRRFTDMSTEHNNLRRYHPDTGEVEVLAGTGGRYFSGGGVDDGVDWPYYPAFDAAGNLYFLDRKHKQVKRLPAEAL